MLSDEALSATTSSQQALIQGNPSSLSPPQTSMNSNAPLWDQTLALSLYYLTPLSSGTFTSIEREPVSPLIMAVLSFKRKDNGFSSLVHDGGWKVLSFTDRWEVVPRNIFGSSLFPLSRIPGGNRDLILGSI